MKTIFLIVLIFALSVQHKRKIITVKTSIYTVKYSEVYEQPLEVSYNVLCTKTLFSRKGMEFYTCDSIKTSDNKDYIGNDYDKGHMAPAADFSCDKNKLYETFSYLNCALQHKDLNRGVWKNLENHERDIAKQTQISVKIIVHFSKNSIVLPSGATVPDGFTKIIHYAKNQEKYYFPNVSPKQLTYNEYKI